MPNTPRVYFNFSNNNVQTSVPLLRVSHVVARTTKGPVNDPSTLFTSYAAFQRVFGEEIVPDGSVSNIYMAFQKGSKLRISRVANDGAAYGWAGAEAGSVTEPGADDSVLKFTLSDPTGDNDDVVYAFNIRTKYMGEQLFSVAGDFSLNFTFSQQALNRLNLGQVDPEGNLVDAQTVISWSTQPGSANINANSFTNFNNNVANIILVPTGSSGMTLEQVMADLRKRTSWTLKVEVNGKELTSVAPAATLKMSQGNPGTNKSTLDGWKAAMDALVDYNDAYQTILSHVHQHLTENGDGQNLGGIPGDAIAAYNYYVSTYVPKFESVLYVEVPKSNVTFTQVVEALKKIVPAVGYAKNIAYFCGGLKYYDDYGTLQNCDVLGTVLGLGDTAASTYGPWYSFSGMNRGTVADAVGPVMENLGGPSRIDDLQAIAEWYGNLFVIKDTRTQGKRTMLWHGFSSNSIDDSEKFLSIVRLNLYLKKNLRPILESYLEEPNTFSTWKSIYYEAKAILDDLVTRNAMTEYTWQGDQDATSYSDLQVNTEAEVRQGKYHVVLKYKDIVPMQEITIDIVIDSASQNVEISAD